MHWAISDATVGGILQALLLLAVSSTFGLAAENTFTARSVLSSPMRLISTGEGAALCRADHRGRSVTLTFAYDPPDDGLPSGDLLQLPASQFALNGVDCDRARGSEFSFTDDRDVPKMKFQKSLSPFALAVQQAASMGDLMQIFVASSTVPDPPANETAQPQCVYSEPNKISAFLANFLIGMPREDVHIPTPDPREKLILRANVMYGLFNIDIDVPDGTGTLCIFVDEAASESADDDRGKTKASSGTVTEDDDKSKSRTAKLGAGSIIGIVVGAIGTLLAIAVIFTAAHCWKKHNSEISVDTGTGSIISNISFGQLSGLAIT